MQRFEAKTVLITGGNSGIGRATALRFAAEGARVAIIARTAASGNEVAQEIRGQGGEAVFVAADVANSRELAEAFDAVLEKFGAFQIAFNCAGSSGAAQPFETMDEAQFDSIVKVNLYGTFYAMRHEIAHFRASQGGVIVNCASTSGLVGLPQFGAYCASKHGVLGLTKSVALEYAARGIRVNAVCPGGVLTPMLSAHLAANPGARGAIDAAHPIGRMAEPDEIAGLVLWLSSNEATNVIGQSFAVDGGYTVQ